MASLSPPAFYSAWIPALLAASAVPHATPADVVIDAGGVSWPVVTMAIAAVGVLTARLLSPRSQPPLLFGRAALLTLVLLVVAELWVIDTRPGLLFAFVVSIGLGFSGYSLIELMGDQIADYLRRLVAALPLPGRKSATSTADPATPDPPDPNEDDA